MDAGVGLNFLVNVFGCVAERAKGASCQCGRGRQEGGVLQGGRCGGRTASCMH